MNVRRSARFLLVTAALVLAACGDTIATDAPRRGAGEAATWVPLPEPPLSARHEPLMAALGRRVLVVGGRDTPACPPNADCTAPAKPALLDGAIYDPDGRSWQPLPPAPIPVTNSDDRAEVGTAVWTLQHVDGAPVLLAYDDTAGWRTVPVPNPSGGRISAAGTRIVVYPRSHEHGGLVPDRVYDPDANAWTQLPLDPIGSAYDRTLLGVDDGVVLLAIPLTDVPPPDRPRVFHAARYTASTSSWAPLPPSGIPGYADTWHRWGQRIVNPTRGSVDGGQVNPFDRAYELGGILLDEREWTPLPHFKDLPVGSGSSVIAAGGRWVVSFKGAAGAPLAVLDIASLTWQELETTPLMARTGAGRVVAGDRVYVWGGADFDLPSPRGRLHNDGVEATLR
jgi:hypothetical protein